MCINPHVSRHWRRTGRPSGLPKQIARNQQQCATKFNSSMLAGTAPRMRLTYPSSSRTAQRSSAAPKSTSYRSTAAGTPTLRSAWSGDTAPAITTAVRLPFGAMDGSAAAVATTALVASSTALAASTMPARIAKSGLAPDSSSSRQAGPTTKMF